MAVRFHVPDAETPPSRPPRREKLPRNLMTTLAQGRVVLPRCHLATDGTISFMTLSTFRHGVVINKTFMESQCADIRDTIDDLQIDCQWQLKRGAKKVERTFYLLQRLLTEWHEAISLWDEVLARFKAYRHESEIMDRPIFVFPDPSFDSSLSKLGKRARREAVKARATFIHSGWSIRTLYYGFLSHLRDLYRLEHDVEVLKFLVHRNLYSARLPDLAFVNPSCGCLQCCVVKNCPRSPQDGDEVMKTVCLVPEVLQAWETRRQRKMEKCVSPHPSDTTDNDSETSVDQDGPLDTGQ